MWSGGRKRGRLYLGSRVALLQVEGHSLVTLEYPPTLPFSAMLQQLALKSLQHGIDLNRAVLDVDLSAGLCKGVALSSPINLGDSANLSSEMWQVIAAQLPWRLEQCAWPSGSVRSGLLPVTTQGLIRNLLAWATAKKIKIGLVQALWAVVTHSQRAKPDAVQSIAFSEPDGVVVFTPRDISASTQQQAMWKFFANSEAVKIGQRLQDVVVMQQMSKSPTVIFQFHSKDGFGNEPGLNAWAGHWGHV